VNLAKPRLFAAYFLMVLLMVCVGLFTVYASEGRIAPNICEEIGDISAINDEMIVNASWLDSETLRIDVVDVHIGATSSFAIRLNDILTSADAQNIRYLLIQAADLDGNLSGVIQIPNPSYILSNAEEGTTVNNQMDNTLNPSHPDGDANVADDVNIESPHHGLTPDGTGTVVDNIVTQSEIEFFTVFTEDGNVFFLVVDRQRNSDNVYLLNAVTEDDLMSLARQGQPPADTSVSVVPAPPHIELPIGEQVQPPSSPPSYSESGATEEITSAGSGNNWVFITIVIAAVGGSAYYFKIIKGKKSSNMQDDDWDYEDDEDDYIDSDDMDEGDGEG